MSKNCPKCGAVISDTAKFCGKCGCNVKEYEQKTVDAFCTECGAKRSLGDTFCPECGARYENGEDNTAKADGFDFSDVDGWGETLSKFNAVEEANRFVDFTYRKMPNGKIIIEKLLDEYAFEVVIPNGVTAIGDGAFENSGVLSVTLPNGITAIGKRVFANCKSLEIINFPESLIKIDDEAFLGCENLEIEIPNTVKIVGNNTINGTKTDILKKKAEEEARRRAEEEARKKAEAEAKKLQVGGNHTFGAYYQSNATTKEPIEWTVLVREQDKALLISKKILTYKEFNSLDVDTTWETCDLRKWLNGEFYNVAFNEDEKRIIQTTKVEAEAGRIGTIGGNITQDKVFILSLKEAGRYFSSDSQRVCSDTNVCIGGSSFRGWWWLRTPGASQKQTAGVLKEGRISDNFSGVASYNLGVRPAMWVSLK